MVSANMADKSIFVREMYKAFVDQSKKQFGVVFSQSQFVIGLPATNWAAGSGYMPPAAIVSGVQQLKTQGYNPRGLMDWSVNWDSTYVTSNLGAFTSCRFSFPACPCFAGWPPSAHLLAAALIAVTAIRSWVPTDPLSRLALRSPQRPPRPLPRRPAQRPCRPPPPQRYA
jgi:hypothetical protein